jgi:hypothetical protein
MEKLVENMLSAASVWDYPYCYWNWENSFQKLFRRSAFSLFFTFPAVAPVGKNINKNFSKRLGWKDFRKCKEMQEIDQWEIFSSHK